MRAAVARRPRHGNLPVFHYDNGLRITTCDLAVDVRRRQPRAFVSHAHFDHMGRHAFALCTAETSQLYQHRLGKRDTRSMPLGEAIEWGGVQLTAYPAGHCLGSAMLYVEDDGQSLLYTGDFKLGESLTSAPCELPRADVLVIESTYGDPHYRFPPRAESIEQLLAAVDECLREERTPVIQAYALGKAQEVTKLLTSHGHRVWQSPDVYEISQVYESCGMLLGDVRRLDERAIRQGEVAGGAVVAAPGNRAGGLLALFERKATIVTSGWALAPWKRTRSRADYSIALSDHADYDDLLEAIRRVEPREIYCTHGPVAFVDRLRDLGHCAYPLAKHFQRRLF